MPFDPDDPVKVAGGDEGSEGAGDTRGATEGDATHQTEPDVGAEPAEEAVAVAVAAAATDPDPGKAKGLPARLGEKAAAAKRPRAGEKATKQEPAKKAKKK